MPLYIMPCLCVKNKTWVNLTQLQIQKYLIKELLIPQNETGRAKNKLISRTDSRQSSVSMGIVGAAFLCGMYGLLFLSDVPYLNLHIRATWTGRPDQRKALKKKEKKTFQKKKPKNASNK